MSGTIPLSLTQQFNEFGKPLKGGQLFLIQAGTVSTPQDGFQDSQLTIKMPYPITLDAAGRIPQFFLADGFIKVRLQDAIGVVQLAADAIQVIGPSGGGGGGTPVDPNSLIQMGNIIARYSVGGLAGYVRLNGLTIGSAVSGATERANADCQALFQFLWPDLNLAVSGGRGASAALDWAANKRIAIPDWRGCALAAMDDMGNVPAVRLTTAFFGNSPLVLGNAGGAESVGLTTPQLPVHAHPNVLNWFDPGHTHPWFNYDGGSVNAGGGFGGVKSPDTITSAPTNISASITNANAGGGLAHGNIQPTRLCTFYIKL